MNNRQRVFTALQQQNGSPLSPNELELLIASQPKPLRPLSFEAIAAALKWLVSTGRAQKHRRRRDFGYSLTDNSPLPVDGRTREGRSTDGNT